MNYFTLISYAISHFFLMLFIYLHCAPLFGADNRSHLLFFIFCTKYA